MKRFVVAGVESSARFMTMRACLLLVFVICSSLNAQTLWQGTEVGMSPAQIRKLFPESHEFKPENGATLDKGVSILQLDKTVIAEEPLNAQFTFKDDKLSEVNLWRRDAEAATFEKFRDLLKTKYGAPFSFKQSLSEYIWIAGKTQITLEFMDPLPVVRITYEAHHLEESNKL